MPRPTAVRFGISSAASLTGLYAVAALWNPVMIVAAIVFAAALAGLLRGHRWSGYGCALFVLAAAAGLLSSELRLGLGFMPPVSLATLAVLAILLAILLFRAGRALPDSTRGRALWIALATFILFFTATMKPFVIPTGAMENTLLIGDQLYVRVAGPYTPARGDIVAFHYPPDPKQTFVKRIVGVPGDRVRFQSKTLVLNGIPQNEPYVRHSTDYVDAFRDNFPAEPHIQLAAWGNELPAHITNGELIVPPGKYFVLGDNRDNSLDSRYWGFIDRAAIIGRPAFIYFSSGRSADELQAPQLAPPILFTPSRIRWSRLFHPVQ